MNRRNKPRNRRTHREILEDIERQLQELQEAQQRMEVKLEQAIANLKASVDSLTVMVDQILVRVSEAGNPADVDAERARIDALSERLAQALQG